MMDENAQNIIKQALIIETQHRTAFIEQIEDKELRQNIEFLLQDDQALTQFLLATSAATTTALEAVAAKDLQAGDRIKQFIIKKLLAKGGMGSVYLAYDEKLKRNVAIKTIRAENLKSHATQQRFKQEAQILSQINHPTICQIYDYIDYENFDVLVLELVEGTTLNQIELSNKQKLDVFIKIASALVAAHDKDIIHRDLKPDNIMLTKEGDIKILDFGIAKSTVLDDGKFTWFEQEGEQADEQDIKPVTKMGTMMGTLLYMSPEQAQGQAVTPASDMYSFGIIMQEMLTGVAVYDLHSTKELKKQVVKAQRINTDLVPKHYKKIIDMLTHKSPEKRPTATKVQKELKFLKERHKKIAKIAFIMVLITLFTLSIYLKTNHQKQQEENLFISQVENEIYEVSNTWQKIYFLPLHDITKDVQRLEKKTKIIITEINKNKSLNEVKKKYLFAEIYTVDKQYRKAEKLYQSVWNKEKSLYDVALKLAYVKSFIFRNNLYASSENNNINAQKKHQQLRDDALKEIRKYLDYEKSSQTEKAEASLPNALLLWTENKIEKAIKVLDVVIEQEDWLFEAYQMKAQIYSTLGNYAYQNNEIDKTKKYFDQARKVYLETLQRGRSYPHAYKGLCQIDFNNVVFAVQNNKKEPIEAYQEGVNACQSLLIATPTDLKGYHMLTKINYWYGQAVMAKGNDASYYFEQAKKYNQYILNNKADFNAYYSQGNILILSAKNTMKKGISPINQAESAIKVYKKALLFNKGRIAYINGQSIFSLVVEMKYFYQVGHDTHQLLNRAKEFYQEVELSTLDSRTAYELKQLMVDAYIAHSQYLQLAQLDSNEFLSSALALLDMNDKASEINAETMFRYAHILFLQAQQNGTSMLLAKEAIEKTLSRQTQNAETFLLAGQIYREHALYEFKQQKQEINLTKAIDSLKKSLDINPNFTEAMVELAKTYELQARLQKNKKDVKYLLNLALEMLKKALSINPDNAFAYAIKVKLLMLNGQENPKKQSKILKLQTKAESINPLLKPESVTPLRR
ncbi:MAG: protein kinase domain-containing protein [bacterium]